MKILFLSHHWTNNSHHSKYSGFQRLVVEAAKSNEVTLVTWAGEESTYKDEQGITVVTVKAKRRDFFFQKRMRISRRGSQISPGFGVVHALYSDCTYFLPDRGYTVTFHVLPNLVKYKGIRQKMFIHLKYWILQKRAMRRSRNIACVSSNLVDLIPNQYKSKTRFIPHGVDTDFWNPGLVHDSAMRDLQPYILSVGSHGVDQNLLQEFIVQNPGHKFILVGVGENNGRYSNVLHLSGLADEELRSLYYHADAFIKPLLFATANNSILEAMSMGKTIITSRISGIADYLNDSTCVFIDTLQDRSLANLNAYKRDQDLVRDHAIKKFSWKVILDQYFRCYTSTPQNL